MAVRPILFSTPMICALLEGRKTQTRRLHERNLRSRTKLGATQNARESKYSPGDILWVRETAHYGPDRVAYSADNPRLGKGEKVDGWGPKKPSIFMPRWASRLTLEITDVRVQRLQDISEEDADAEGFGGDFPSAALPEVFPGNAEAWSHLSVAECYGHLWNHINGTAPPRDWDSNPWVVALTFAVHKMNVDALLAQRADRAKETASDWKSWSDLHGTRDQDGDFGSVIDQVRASANEG